jgi:hypothetical protein
MVASQHVPAQQDAIGGRVQKQPELQRARKKRLISRVMFGEVCC